MNASAIARLEQTFSRAKKIAVAVFALSAIVVFSAQGAMGANWPSGMPHPVITDDPNNASQTTISVSSNGSLYGQKTHVVNTSGSADQEVRRGGAAAVIMPSISKDGSGKSVTKAKILSVTGLSVDGYGTTINHDNDLYDTNVFGPLVIFGSPYASSAEGLMGTSYDGKFVAPIGALEYSVDHVTDLDKVDIGNVSFSNNVSTLNVLGDIGASSGVSSGFGGAARLVNLPELTYSKGVLSGNKLHVFSATADAARVNGLHANGGALAIESDFGTAASKNGTVLNDLHFAQNEVVIGASGGALPGVDSNARGGAIYVAGYNNEKEKTNSVSNQGLKFTVKEGSTFTGNKAVNNGNGHAAGGAVYTNLAVKSTFKDVTFSNNSAISSGASASGGAVAMQFADSLGVGSGGSTNNTLTALGSVKIGNSTVSYYSSFDNVLFSGNTAVATGNGDALGGAVSAAGIAGKSVIEISGSGFSKNSVTVDTGTARGGAVYSTDDLVIGNMSIFSENLASGGATGSALGGAVYVSGGRQLYLDSVAFLDNVAKAQTAGQARGGAIYYESNANNAISNAFFEKNSARLGGAVFVDGGAYTVSNAEFLENAASEKGGAIYMDTANANAVLTLDSGEKGLLFSGNNDSSGANAVYFGSSTGTASGNAAALNFKGENYISLLDGFTVELGTTGAFALRNSNTKGVVTLGGLSNVTAQKADVNFDVGSKTAFANSFTMIANNQTRLVVADGGATYAINSDRDSNLALFQFDPSASGNLFDFKSGTSVFEYGEVTALFPFEKEYLVAEGIGAANVNQSVGSYGDNAQMRLKGDDLWLNLRYTGNRDALENGGWNFYATANGAIDDAIGKSGLTGEQVAQIGRNANDAVPGFAMNMGFVGLSAMHSAQSAALKFGNGRYGVYAGGCGDEDPSACERGLCSAPDFLHCGLRFWAGYIGNFDRLDSYDGFYGYKADQRGFVSGLNYDFGDAGSIGLFGGYSRTKTEARDITSRVETDAGHFGLVGRLAPLGECRNFNIGVDLGYTFTNNSSWREMGMAGQASGRFNQTLYTAGLQFDYDINFAGSGAITPFAGVRYSHVKQDAFSEAGVLAASLDGFGGYSLATRLGVGMSYDVLFDGGVITPGFTAAWRRESGDSQFESLASYNVKDPIWFAQRSSELSGRNFAEVGASLRIAFDMGNDSQVGLNGGYVFEASGNQKKHSAYAGFDLSF